MPVTAAAVVFVGTIITVVVITMDMVDRMDDMDMMAMVVMGMMAMFNDAVVLSVRVPVKVGHLKVSMVGASGAT